MPVTETVKLPKRYTKRLISLFELTMPPVRENGAPRVIRIHSDSVNKPIIYNGATYQPWPCQFTGGSSENLDDPSDSPQLQVCHILSSA